MTGDAPTREPLDPPVLVALDVSEATEAVRIARRLREVVGGFKVGLELLHGPGPGVVAAVAEIGLPVFVDAKLHDIPNTVGAASRNLARWGARWISAHASGGEAMLVAAREGAFEGSGGRTGILAITVLTSLTAGDLERIGVGRSPGRQVGRLAKLAAAAGAEGVVAPVRELKPVADAAPGLLRVTPGIRPPGSQADDQASVATPAEAIRRGADLLVVGRPILRAHDPVAAARAIVDEVTAARDGS